MNEAWQPINADLEVIPADNSKELKLGFKVWEHPVSILADYMGQIRCCCGICKKDWMVKSWNDVNKESDEHIIAEHKDSEFYKSKFEEA